MNVANCDEYMNTSAALCATVLESNHILSVALSEHDYCSLIINELKLIYDLQDSFREVSQQICFCTQDNCNSNRNKCLNATRTLIPSNNSQRISQHEISCRLHISRRSIRRIIRKFDEFHTIDTKPERRLIKLQQLLDHTRSLTDLVRYSLRV
ncbi:hypothetical protein I4U23_004770 [Adineta vaga]|nr:hypothetical protein I4U23_004770 [Adineta vaga]